MNAESSWANVSCHIQRHVPSTQIGVGNLAADVDQNGASKILHRVDPVD